MRKILSGCAAVLAAFSLLLAGCSGETPAASDVSGGSPSGTTGTGLSGSTDPGVSGMTGSTEPGASDVSGSETRPVNVGNDNDNDESSGSSSPGSGSSTSGGDGQGSTLPDNVLDDDLNDWSKVFQHGSQSLFEGQFDYFFENDSSRVIPGVANTDDCWFTYKVDEGIEEFEAVTYRVTYDDKLPEVKFLVSTDNKTWTELKDLTIKVGEMSSEWEKVVYSKKGIDSKYTYFKVQLPNHESAFCYNIGRVRINEIDSMYDPTRWREGRDAATFYVDAKGGNDNNDGMSPDSAFKSLFKVSSKYYQPGDKILFKCGTTFSGTLEIRGDGTESSPILVGSYGEGDKPVIRGRSGRAITLRAYHIKVENLDITNPSGEVGIQIMPPVSGENKNITIDNCTFRDINTSKSNMAFETGAIEVMAGGLDPTWFDGLYFTNNTMTNVNRLGIFVSSQWANRPGGWGYNDYKSDTENWYPAKNVVVRGNTMDTIGGDGIVVYGADKPVIEKNVMYRGYNCTTQQHSGSCGIWVHNTNDAVIQYNEVGYMDLKAGQADGEAYNIDIANKRTTLQYNYSHNNAAGFLLMCNVNEAVHTGHVVRYNVSINDYGDMTSGSDSTWAGLILITGSVKDSHIYNNTFYIGGKARTTKPLLIGNWNGGEIAPSGLTIENNIFHAESGINIAWRLDGSSLTFKNNLYSGAAKNKAPSSETNAKNADVTFSGSLPSSLDGRNTALNLRPKNLPSGASAISNNGGKDYNGDNLKGNFYGAINP